MQKFRFTADFSFEANNHGEAIDRIMQAFSTIKSGKAIATHFEGDFDLEIISPIKQEEPKTLHSRNPHIAKVIAGGASYDRQIISTSVPPLEELNKEGVLSPDEDLF